MSESSAVILGDRTEHEPRYLAAVAKACAVLGAGHARLTVVVQVAQS